MEVEMILRINDKDIYINQSMPMCSAVCEVPDEEKLSKEEQQKLLEWLEKHYKY